MKKYCGVCFAYITPETLSGEGMFKELDAQDLNDGEARTMANGIH